MSALQHACFVMPTLYDAHLQMPKISTL